MRIEETDIDKPTLQILNLECQVEGPDVVTRDIYVIGIYHRKTFVVYDGGSDRLHKTRSGPQCRQQNITYKRDIISLQREVEKNPMASITVQGEKWLFIAIVFTFYFSPHTYVTLKFQTGAKSKSKDVFPKLMQWGCETENEKLFRRLYGCSHCSLCWEP
ncbi:hypothetical protein QTP88_008866 [Uroleucon formosanum]